MSTDPIDPLYLLDCFGQLPTPPPSPFTKAGSAKGSFSGSFSDMGERYSTLSPLLQELSAYALPDPPIWPNTDHLAGVRMPVQEQQQTSEQFEPVQHGLLKYALAQHVPTHHPQAQPIPTPHVPKKRGPYKTKDKSLKAARISPENRVVGRGGMVSLGHSREVTDMLKAQAEAQAQAQVQLQVQAQAQAPEQTQPQVRTQAPAQPRNEEVHKDVEMKLYSPLSTDTTSKDENRDEEVDGGAVLPPCPYTNQTETAAVTAQEGGVSMVGKTADGREKGKGRAV